METVTISKTEYEMLLNDRRKLHELLLDKATHKHGVEKRSDNNEKRNNINESRVK